LDPPVFWGYLFAFCAAMLLVLFGGGQHVVALGLALFLPGFALFFVLPKTGLGKLGDFGVLGLLLVLLFAFLPQFYWPAPEWRVLAVESLGFELPGVLSVQPWISFEAWLLVLAGFAWLYVALQLPINLRGRHRLFFFVSILFAAMAGLVVWGNLMGLHYPGADEAGTFSFFPDRNQTANFLALGGVVTFAYAMEAVRLGKLFPLIGALASGLCLVALVLSESRVGVVLYFLGMAIWYGCNLRARTLPRFLKIGFPVVVTMLCLVVMSVDKAAQGVSSFAASTTAEPQLGDGVRWGLYQDASRMLLDAPLTGFGLGSFSVVFPQYREASASPEAVFHPESDFIWLATEGGLLALGFLLFVLVGYALRCRGFMQGMSASYRVLALAPVLLFFLHSLMDVSGHRPGTVYLAILFAALALPGRNRPKSYFSLRCWRFVGVGLMLFGLVWLLAGAFGLPWHSSVRLKQLQSQVQSDLEMLDTRAAGEAMASWLQFRPLDWQAYFQRAELALSASDVDVDAASLDFERARFVEPVLGSLSYAEGVLWLPHDVDHTLAAWRETLSRELEDVDLTFARMVDQAEGSSALSSGLARISEANPHHRALYLSLARGDILTDELRLELEEDPSLSKFTLEQRTQIVTNWIEHGNLLLAEAFVDEHADSLINSWWLKALCLKDQAKFEEAVGVVREHVELPKLPVVEEEDMVLSRLVRAYVVASDDVMQGTALLYYYTEQSDFEQALLVVDRMLETVEPPLSLYYWRAECLFQIEDYIESWFALEVYFEHLWGRGPESTQSLRSGQ
jgi:hypothetical protein